MARKKPPEDSEFRQPFDTWSNAKKAQADKLINILNDVMNYRTAPAGMAANKNARNLSDQITARGGLHPDEAQQLSLYRASKELANGDPNWQGPVTKPSYNPIYSKLVYNDVLGKWGASPEELAAIKKPMVPTHVEEPMMQQASLQGRQMSGTYEPSAVATLAKPDSENERLIDAQLKMLYALATSGQNTNVQSVQPPLMAPQDLRPYYPQGR